MTTNTNIMEAQHGHRLQHKLKKHNTYLSQTLPVLCQLNRHKTAKMAIYTYNKIILIYYGGVTLCRQIELPPLSRHLDVTTQAVW